MVRIDGVTFACRTIHLCALTALALAMGNAQSGSGRKLDALIETIRAEVHPQDAMERMRRIYSTDRWFTFSKFQQTADYLKSALTDMGLDHIEMLAAPADGVSQFGFWTEPMAWDVKQAKLEIIEPAVPADQAVLADFEKVPTSLGMWSGSTPPEGATAEIVELTGTSEAEILKQNLRGKLVLTRVNPANIKWLLVKGGAIGAVNAFTENPSLQDGRQWINAWGDNGWAFTRTSTPLLSFSITPRQAEFLRKLLRDRSPVRVRARVDTRYYAGKYPYVTALIPGTSNEEVMTLGHSSEQGAQDNATGVSAMLESVATLNRLIRSGKLPVPKRSIRILTMGEMYGSMHYVATHRGRIERTVAAVCLDTPASPYELPGTEYSFYMNPHSGASYVDAFILKVAEAYLPKVGRPWHAMPFTPGTDSYMGEPLVGIPTTWAYSGTGVVTHHNSEDTPDRVDQRSLRDITIVDAAFLYYLANAGEPEARWLAEISADYWRSRAGGGSDAKTAYASDRQRQAVLSVLRLVPPERRAGLRASLPESVLKSARPPQAAVKPDGDSVVVVRKRFGTLPLDDLPPDQREGFPNGAWDTPAITALYWCDGHRTLGEVKRLTQLELGPVQLDLDAYFLFLARHGYVEIRK
jgi:Peptidase family M28